MKKALFIAIVLCIFNWGEVFSQSSPVRIKDITHVLEAKENQLMGFGLVVGLKNTGDSYQTEFTKQALTNLLSRMGIPPQDKEFKSKNIAAVMVTAKLPAFVNIGQKLDVTVSSLGDATSLRGGTLLMTPLQGGDDKTYAVAQGAISLGLTGSEGESPNIERKQTAAGRVLNGAIVEDDVSVTLADNFVTLILNNPDYTTASRIVSAMRVSGIGARARDAATIITSKDAEQDMVDFISKIENLTIVPDSVAKVIINERTGVIVLGENVKISPVAISYNDINVSISSNATLSDLVSALNTIGIRPKDLVALLQAVKAAGAISADLEVI